MAILVIYIVLGILYESIVHPLTILSGLPAAAFGALATLMPFHMQLDLFGFVASPCRARAQGHRQGLETRWRLFSQVASSLRGDDQVGAFDVRPSSTRKFSR